MYNGIHTGICPGLGYSDHSEDREGCVPVGELSLVRGNFRSRYTGLLLTVVVFKFVVNPVSATCQRQQQLCPTKCNPDRSMLLSLGPSLWLYCFDAHARSANVCLVSVTCPHRLKSVAIGRLLTSDEGTIKREEEPITFCIRSEGCLPNWFGTTFFTPSRGAFS